MYLKQGFCRILFIFSFCISYYCSSMSLSVTEAQEYCRLVQGQYKKHGKRGKPTNMEWNHLAGIVVKVVEDKSQVASLGTGTKCLGTNSVDKEGFTVNDSHAEVLARRSFISFLYAEILEVLSKNKTSDIICFNTETKKFAVQPGVSFHLYCSHTPCGDGSIIDIDSEASHGPPSKRHKSEPDILRTGAKCTVSGPQDPFKSGTDYHVLGAFRTKPGRGDPTLSMSCSDKIAKWTVMGIQGSLLMRYLEKPIYLESIIFGRCPFSKKSLIRAVCERNRNFCSPSEQYSFHEPTILQTSLSPVSLCENEEKASPSPLAVVWNCTMERPEVLVEGYRQGVTTKNLKSPKARSTVSRWSFGRSFMRVQQMLHKSDCPIGSFYLDVKHSVQGYKDVWNLLKLHYKHWITDSRKETAQRFQMKLD